MTLTFPPDAVTALRDMLLDCTAVTLAGLGTNSIYYPELTIDPDAGDADTVPCALIMQTGYNRSSFAEGAQGLPGGSLSVVFYLSGDGIGSTEQFAQDVCSQLMEQQTGLPITNATHDEAKRATSGLRANNTEYTTVDIQIDWGLTA